MNQFIIVRTLAIAFALVASSSHHARAEEPVLTGLDAVYAMIGNTVIFNHRGALVAIFFAPDHSTTAKMGKEVESSKWRMSADKLCFGPDDKCASVEVRGKHVKMTAENHETFEGELLSGNPLKL